MLRIAIPRHVDLQGLRDAVAELDEWNKKLVKFVAQPSEVMQIVRENPFVPALIVSGFQIGNERGPEDIALGNAIALAEAVKRVNSRAIFLLYSRCPEWTQHIDGNIPKKLRQSPEFYHLPAQILTVDGKGVTNVQKLKELCPLLEVRDKPLVAA